jgi:hypothetical protein
MLEPLDVHPSQNAAPEAATMPGLRVPRMRPMALSIALAVVACTGSGCGDSTLPPCMQNLHQIGQALHAYHDDWKAFPKAAISDHQGRPGLSWRVAILPYLSEKGLFDKFHLDEPWDGPHNRQLLDEMPAVYACPGNYHSHPSLTTYRAFTGQGAFFEPPFDAKFAPIWWTDPDGTKHYQTEPPNGLSIASFTDGTSNTLMVVEAKYAVPWTLPEGLSIEIGPSAGDDPLLGAGAPHRQGFSALFVDGAVRVIKRTISPNVLRALITRRGDEVVDLNAL